MKLVFTLLSSFFIAFLLSGCTSKEEEKEASYRKVFLSSCIQSGGNKSVCSCGLQKLEDEYGIKYLIEAEESNSPKRLQELLIAARAKAAICLMNE